LAAVTLSIGFFIGDAFLVSAHNGSLSEQDICTTTGSAATAEAPFLAENDAAMALMLCADRVPETIAHFKRSALTQAGSIDPRDDRICASLAAIKIKP
jgi:hypothetical protein